jgi:hypothetical protein
MVYARVHVRGKGRCMEGAAVLASGPTAAPLAAGPPAAGAPPAAAGAAPPGLRVCGYVCSALPRGAPEGYPGGLALCSGPLLAAEPREDSVQGSGQRGRAALRVWLRNPGSSALREASLHVLRPG